MASKTDMEAVDTQLLKAARETLRRGKFIRLPQVQGRTIHVSIVERSGTSTVSADPDWVQAPACTCHDHWSNVRYGPGPWCRHVVAVLAQEEELRCQLIDLLL